MKGELFILSSPAGGGKTTISNRLVKEIPLIKRVITCTTRSPRKNEEPGKDYIFLSKDEFERKINENQFLEYALVHGNYYGTPKKEVEEELSKGYDLLLVIDVQGMRQVKSRKIDVITIFLLPPSIEDLVIRMKKRGDSPEEIKKRLETAKREIPAWKEYDYVVINDNLEEAIFNLKSIVISNRLKKERFNTHLIKDRNLRELMGDG